MGPGEQSGAAGRPVRSAWDVIAFVWLPGLLAVTALGAALVVLGIVSAARGGGGLAYAAGGLPFLLFAIIVFAALARRGALRRRLRATGVSTTGQITAEARRQYHRRSIQTVRYAYADAEGGEHTGSYTIGGRFFPDPPRYEIGDAIEIIHLPERPDRARPALDLFLDPAESRTLP